MNHPSKQELAEFLYEELPPHLKAEVSAHIASCAECRDAVDSWRATRAELGAWKLPPIRTAAVWSGLRWPIAAAAMLALGFALSQFTTPPAPDPALLRAQLTAEVRREMKSELAEFAAAQLAQQKSYQDTVADGFSRMEAQRVVDLLSLRHAVETVAVNAEDQLESTRQDIYQLASAEETAAPQSRTPTGRTTQ